MSTWRSRCLAEAVALGTVLAASPAAAQPADQPSTNWSVTAGTATFTMRDVARTGPPVDASPIAWEGVGPMATVRYERTRPARLHRFEATFASAGRFSYETPLRSEPADAGDSAQSFGGAYEYRRRWFSKVLPHWLDAGIGARALVDTMSMSLHVPPSLESHERDNRFGGAGVLAARLQRWHRIALDVDWANGIRIAHVTRTHTAEPSDALGWGPGWLTDLAVRADVALSPSASIVVEYLRSGDGVLSTHHGFAAQSNGIAAGMRYGR